MSGGADNQPDPAVTCFQKMSFSSFVGNCKTMLLRNSTPAGNNQLEIPLSRIRRATKNFRSKNHIGEGSSAHVFKGKFGNGKIVAVKRLKRAVDWDTDYKNEVDLLSRLNHDNIIRLIGHCDDEVGAEKVIVYEFMALGSLFDHLHARRTAGTVFGWDTRMRILAGVATGLSYLHYVADPPVIYRDLKPTNILLGDGFHPRISDFRIAISAPSEAPPSRVTSTVVMGTLPYWAPENVIGKDSLKSDVYSFGALMLDMIIGYVPLDTSSGGAVAPWVKKTNTNLVRMADPELNGAFPEDKFRRAKNLALRCMDINPASRPEMKDVVLGMNHLLPGSQAAWPVGFDIDI
ncbi:hypothetical protein CASFOL_003466 [Castilleja foliolosa]|uniref:Protein kinase domain-containing protein n=1 Tax=Castilleja foliolosa TaxID=1961234 RepID=A0ABD3EKZ6_9LAMI